MAVRHLHRLHYHRLHLLLLAQNFILHSKLGSSANPFLHRPSPFLPDWESLPNRYSALSLAHVCACVTGFQHTELYRFGRFAPD